MAPFLVIVASAIYALLGISHGALTLADLAATPRFFTPPDAALRQAMQASGVRLHPEINLWRAYMGFNLTHSLGLALFGGVFLYVGVAEPERLASPMPAVVAAAISGTYFLISRSLFFSGPAAATGLATLLFAVAALL